MNAAHRIASRPKRLAVLRTDLIGGGLVAASLLAGLTHLLMQAPSPASLAALPEPVSGLAELKAAEPAPILPVRVAATQARSTQRARLPRARPDEPLTTGSIGPPRVKPASGPEIALRGSDSGAALASIAEDLRGRAFLIASSSAQCDHVVDAEVLGGAGESPVVVGIRCNNGAIFYLDRHAILVNQIAWSEPAP